MPDACSSAAECWCSFYRTYSDLFESGGAHEEQVDTMDRRRHFRRVDSLHLAHAPRQGLGHQRIRQAAAAFQWPLPTDGFARAQFVAATSRETERSPEG